MCTRTKLAVAALTACLSAGIGSAAESMRGSLAGDGAMTITGDAGEIIFSAVQAAQESAMAAVTPATAPEIDESEVDHTDPGQRLLDRTPDEIEPYFDLYLYISKAVAGPIAQHMFVYERHTDGSLALLYDWPVSTGREQREKTPAGRKTYTHTPEGIFKLDPDRFFKVWHSRTWNADMPWAMFFDLMENGGISGLAVHAAGKGKISQLGRRASGGCIRLAPENAKFLFQLLQKSYAGVVPVFAVTDGDTSVVGRPARNEDGSMQLTQGYRVLMHIEDYAGEHLPALSVASYTASTIAAP